MTARFQNARAKSTPVVVEQDHTEFVAADIVLVSCVKTKRPEAAAAKDLYISALFRKERSYAERSGVPWYILSAEHGLVDPEQWLAPYERYLPDESSTYREAWGVKVVDDLEQIEGLMEGKVIEIHAGAVYLEAIRSRLQSRGAVIVEPLRGLPMGKRLRWYDGGNRVPQSGVSRRVDVPLPDIDSLVASVRDESLAVSPKNFLAAGRIGRNLQSDLVWAGHRPHLHANATNMRGMADVEMDEYGRKEIPLSGDETATLLGFLDYQRSTMAWKCRGLNDAQLCTRLPPTSMTLGGMLKHLARVEDYWFSEVVAESEKPEPWATMPWAAEWQNASSQTGEELRQLWAERVEASRRVVAARLEAGEAALGSTHPAWDGQGRPSLRWVLVHMIEEYARHNGHADLIRESIDGETGE